MILENKKTIFRKIRNIGIIFAVVSLSIGIAAIVSTQISFAANSSGESSDDGGGGTPGCYKYKRVHGLISAKSYYDDTCFGGVWWEYPVNGNNNIQVSSYGSVSGGSLKGCVDVGAEKYYRLSLVKYNTNDNYSDPNDIKASKFSMRWSGGAPEQVGLWQVWRFNNDYGGGTTYRSEGLAWGDVKRKFEIAKTRGATMSGNDWKDISMFCYSESWDGMNSSFDAWSWADNTSTASEGPDAKIVKEITTTDEKVTVNFKHQFSYNKPNASADSVFDPANTDWHVDVTEDGRRIGGTNTARFTLVNSGPNRSSIWEDMPYMGESSYEIDMPEGTTSKTVCSKITYTPKNISWDEDQNRDKHYIMNWQNSEGVASSEACIVIKKEAQPTGGDFTSSSTVIIDPADHPGTDIRTLHTLTTDAALSGDRVEILLSTDEPVTHVRFYHQIYWNSSTYPRSTDAANKIQFDSVSNTDYKILDENGGIVSGLSGNHKTSTDNANSGARYAMQTVDVSLKKGETKTVCRKITYDPQDVTYRTRRVNHGTRRNPDWWTHYYVSSTAGNGDSEACATITRPADPKKPGDDPGVVGPKSGGNNVSDPMYAGETVTPSWQGETEAYDTRRLMEWQSIIFQVPVTTGLRDDLVLGNIEVGDQDKGNRKDNWQDPCTWFNTVKRTNYRGCQIVKKSSGTNDESNGSGSEHRYIWPGGNTYEAGRKTELSVGEFSEHLVVPNLVGDKYCNSLGFQFQYYYGYKRSANAEIEWYEDTANPRYWTVYDAACRTIAKKPSVAIWNGGIMTGNGNVITSLASRYDNTSLNTLVSGGGNRISFGSWTEYLATINGTVNNFSSGAILAGGSDSSDLLANSPLTIANRNGSVSPSLITSNTILYNRLQDYLFSKTDESYGSATSSAIGLGTDQTGTRVITVNGKLTIDSNIELSNAAQSSIYTIPQVVIYARDGIDITSNVTRIDAWLATEGTLNTCTSFNEPNTEAQVDRNGWRRNVTCELSLAINGPVFAKNVILNRTYGADGFSNGDTDLADSGDTRAATGEVFNLSADTYLWAYAQSGRYGSSYSEAYSRELPPRY